MLKILLLLCIVPSFLSKDICSPDVNIPSSSDIPNYVINLDLPPQKRWANIAKDKANDTKQLIVDLKSILGNTIVNTLDEIIPELTNTLPSPYKEEIWGLSKASGIPVGEVTLYNIFYEVFSFCTSMVIEDKNGHIRHARNMDFGLFLGWDEKTNTWKISEHLHPLVINLDFRKNGSSIFKATSFAGYIGILTGIKPGKFSLTVNERFQPSGGYEGIIEWIMGNRKQRWVGFLTRDVMEHSMSYEEVAKKLATAQLLSPVYFILGGIKSGQGCVITRGHKSVDIWNLGETSTYQNSTWFVLETNYDHWKNPPFFDNRRKPAISCLENVTQEKINEKRIYQVLSTKPVLNKLTVYTTLMDVEGGKIQSWLRNCSDPCPVW